MVKFFFILLVAAIPFTAFTAPEGKDTEKYLSELEDNIKKDILAHSNTTKQVSVDSSNFEVEKAQNYSNSEKTGSFDQYFNTIEEKKHSMVNFFIEYYSTFGKKRLQEALTQIQKYFPVILKYAKQYNLPPEVLIIPIIENGARVDGTQFGKKGMWLLNESVAEVYGLSINDYTDERMDVEKSTKTALNHFSQLKQAYNNDWDLALTAFNGGGSHFQEKMRELGVGSFWDLYNTKNDFSADILEYVPKFYAILTILKHPSQYNISIPDLKEDEVKFSTITISKSGVSFKDISRLTNMSVEEITKLNPHLYKQYTVKGMNMYIPSNTAYLVNSRIRVAKAIKLRYIANGKNAIYTPIRSTSGKRKAVVAKKSRKQNTTNYKIQPHDTLFGIAKKHNVSVASLMSTNKLTQKSVLKVGKTIKIAKSEPTKIKKTTIAKKNNQSSSKQGLTYTVKSGDTVYSIAKNYKVSMDQVKNHQNGNIKPGDRLIIVK